MTEMGQLSRWETEMTPDFGPLSAMTPNLPPTLSGFALNSTKDLPKHLGFLFTSLCSFVMNNFQHDLNNFYRDPDDLSRPVLADGGDNRARVQVGAEGRRGATCQSSLPRAPGRR